MISSSRIIARASGALLAVLLLGSLGIPGHASARTWPRPQGYVSDFAGVLDAASRDSIEALAAELREKTGAELAVATTPDLGDDDIDAAAVDLFKAWGVGSKSKDEGVLILLAQKERRVRIEVGYGLEGILPDGLCGSIIRHVMAPDLSAERYGPGLLQGARAVVGVIAKDRGVAITGAIQPPSEDDERGGGVTPRSVFMIALLIAIVLSNILRAGARRRGWMGGWGGGGPGGYGGMFGGFGGMGGGFGGGGGGGGFGGFGGGRSGGGGASGGF